MVYIRLFCEFFKIGLFSVGGGMATVPFLFDLGARTGWFTAQNLADMIAISESTPGPIGVNMATYVGCTVANIAGGLVATLGLITPSVIIILIISAFLNKFSEHPIVKTVFSFLRASVIGLVAYALWQVAKVTLFNGSEIMPVALIAYLTMLFFMIKFKKIHPLLWILIGAAFGMLVM